MTKAARDRHSAAEAARRSAAQPLRWYRAGLGGGGGQGWNAVSGDGEGDLFELSRCVGGRQGCFPVRACAECHAVWARDVV